MEGKLSTLFGRAVLIAGMKKLPKSGAFFMPISRCGLELFEEVAGRAGDVDSAGGSALAVLDPLDDAGWFGALGTVGALGGIHCFLTVAGFGYFCHDETPLMLKFGVSRFG
jgi:hypothetical protein